MAEKALKSMLQDITNKKGINSSLNWSLFYYNSEFNSCEKLFY
ncbi:hypothetical protein HJ01_00802 [Flavobacterium frigoris PS1]|uniref:Uncharacterized protein n=1 Tax=Flavobacterium frigoris (strain PS1) TaxID=1086011 RepID=H7FMY6_FLAFP|nr:hypothetical protein HJ01_00802 [Flavobacterium frigoris PS1]